MSNEETSRREIRLLKMSMLIVKRCRCSIVDEFSVCKCTNDGNVGNYYIERITKIKFIFGNEDGKRTAKGKAK